MAQKIINFSIYALVFLIPFFFLPFSAEIVEFNKLYLLIALAALGFFAWIYKMLFQEKTVKIRAGKGDLAILIFLILTVASVFFAKDKITAIWGENTRFWPSLIGVLALGIFYFVCSNNIAVKKQAPENSDALPNKLATVQTLFSSFIGGSIILIALALLSIFGVLAKVAPILSVFKNSPLALPGFSPAGQSIESLAVFLAFLASFLTFLITVKNKRAILPFVALLGSLIILVLISAKVAWVIFSLSLFSFLLFTFWKRTFKNSIGRLTLPTFLLLLAIVFTFFNPVGLLPKNKILSEIPREVTLDQKASWQVAKSQIEESPLLGSGLANFSPSFSQHKPAYFLANPFWQIRFDRPVSYLSEVAATQGILGTLTYLSLSLIFLLSLLKIAIQGKESNPLLFVALFSLISLLITQALYFQNILLAFSFWLILAISSGTILAKKEYKFSFGEFPEAGLVLNVVFWVMIVGFGFLGFSLTRNYIASAYYKDYLQNPGKIANLEKAANAAKNQMAYQILLSKAYTDSLSQEIAQEKPDAKKVNELAVLAIGTVKYTIEKWPQRVEAQETAAFTYGAIQGLAKGAEEWSKKSFEQASALEPKNPILLTQIAKILFNTQDSEKARTYLKKAITIKPDYIAATAILAAVEEKEGNKNTAQDLLEKTAKANAYSPEAYFELGKFYFNDNQINKAEQAFLSAVDLMPNYSNALYSLGLAYQKEGQISKALEYFQKVQELNPNNSEIKKKIESLNNNSEE